MGDTRGEYPFPIRGQALVITHIGSSALQFVENHRIEIPAFRGPSKRWLSEDRPERIKHAAGPLPRGLLSAMELLQLKVAADEANEPLGRTH